MSEALDRSAEVTKLARLLGSPVGELGHLERLSSRALREFRESATDLLFEPDADLLRRIAASARLVPVPLTAKLAETVVGPLLCAAVSGLLDPDRAAKVAARLPVGFLAQVSVDMDPRRSAAVVAAIPPGTVADVATELVDAGEYVAMGRFVGVLPEAALRASMERFDDTALLHTSFVVEDKSSLARVAGLAVDRFGGVILVAHEQDLWQETLDLIGHLGVDELTKVGEAAAALPTDVLDGLVLAAHDHGAWEQLLPATAAMHPDSLARFAAAPALSQPEVLRGVTRAALEHGLVDQLLPIAAHLDADAQALVEELVAEAA